MSQQQQQPQQQQQHGNNMYPQPGNNQPYNSQPYNSQPYNSQPYDAAHPDNNQYATSNRMANQPEPITSSSMGITVPFEKAEINHPHMANANPTRNGYDLINNPNVMSDPSQGPGGHRFVNPDNSGMAAPAYNNNGGLYGNAGTGQNMPGNNVPYNSNTSGHPGQCNSSNMPSNNVPYDNSNLPGNNLPGNNGLYNSNLPGNNGRYNNSNMPGNNGHYNNSNLPGNNGQYGNGPYNGMGAGTNMAGGNHPYNPHNSVMGADEGTILKEKIKGGVEKLAGKITGNPAKVAQGQQRMAAADAAAYHNSNGGGLLSGSRRDPTDNRMM